MKPDYFWLGSFAAPAASSSSDALGMTWEFMEINRNFWAHSHIDLGNKEKVTSQLEVKYLISTEKIDLTQYMAITRLSHNHPRFPKKFFKIPQLRPTDAHQHRMRQESHRRKPHEMWPLRPSPMNSHTKVQGRFFVIRLKQFVFQTHKLSQLRSISGQIERQDRILPQPKLCLQGPSNPKNS